MGLSDGGSGEALRLAGTPMEEAFRDAPVMIARQDLEYARRAGDEVARAKALAFLSGSLLQTGRADEADVAQSSGDLPAQAEALAALGSALARHGHMDEAIAASGAAVRLFRKLGDRENEGETLSSLCVRLMDADRYAEAADAARATLPLVERDAGRRCTALFNLGSALYGAGDHAAAVPVLERAAREWRALHTVRPDADREVLVSAEARTLARLGACLVALGRVDEAIAAHRRAAAFFEECGRRRDKALSLFEVGIAFLGRGAYDDTIPALQAAAREFAALEDPEYELSSLLNLGRALVGAGRSREAVEAGTKAVRLASARGDREKAAMAWFELAESQMTDGRRDDAVYCVERALTMYGSLGDRKNEAIAVHLLGALLTDMDRAEEGVRLSRRAAQMFGELGEAEYREGALRDLRIGLGKLGRA